MKSKAEILQLMGGIPEAVYDSICQSFYDESKTRIENMATAIKNSDTNALAQLSHAIKGSAGNLHLDSIFEVAKNMEQAAKAGDLNTVQQLFPTFKSFFK